MTDDARAFGRTTAALVELPVVEGGAAPLRSLLQNARPDGGTATDWLLADVVTVSLLLEPTEGPGGILVWYVERAGTADESATAAVSRSPLLQGEVGNHLELDPRSWSEAPAPVIHATNPNRPATPTSPDVVLVRLGVSPGIGAWLARIIVFLMGVFEGTWLQRRLETSSTAVLEEERMWTETIWLERFDGRYVVRWYMEADDMDRAIEAYETTDSRLARWSELVSNRLFDKPLSQLVNPMEASEYELLVHATNPGRR